MSPYTVCFVIRFPGSLTRAFLSYFLSVGSFSPTAICVLVEFSFFEGIGFALVGDDVVATCSVREG